LTFAVFFCGMFCTEVMCFVEKVNLSNIILFYYTDSVSMGENDWGFYDLCVEGIIWIFFMKCKFSPATAVFYWFFRQACRRMITNHFPNSMHLSNGYEKQYCQNPIITKLIRTFMLLHYVQALLLCLKTLIIFINKFNSPNHIKWSITH
jgi:hypothetical protein